MSIISKAAVCAAMFSMITMSLGICYIQTKVNELKVQAECQAEKYVELTNDIVEFQHNLTKTLRHMAQAIKDNRLSCNELSRNERK